MEAIVKETLKEWLGDSWEKSVSEVEDVKKIELVLLDLIKQCMPTEDFELFSLVTKIHNDLIAEEQEEEEKENFIATHDLDEDFDIMEEDFPLSRFNIDYQKFKTLVLGQYNWIFERYPRLNSNEFNPSQDIACESYIYMLAFTINLSWNDFKYEIIRDYNKKIKEEALSILNRKWEDISIEDYERAIEMLKSVKAYDELIEVLSTGVDIKGEYGWKVRKADKIEALKIEEEATKTDNVTLKDWVNLLGWDDNSRINHEKTYEGILEKLYNEGSGLASLILGDYTFKSLLSLVAIGIMYKDWSEWRFKAISESLCKILRYYKKAAERNCAIGYRNCALIYYVSGDKDKSESFEQDYQKSPYDYKRSAFNLDRDYNKRLEWDKECGFSSINKYWYPAPFSIIALNEQKAKKYLKKIFKGIDLKQLRIT